MTTPQSPQKSKKDHLQKFHYAWIIAVVTFIVLLASAGVRNAASVIIRPLETEFAWDRATISFAFSISLILFGLGGALGGTLVDRFGPRRVMLGGIVVTGAGLLLLLTMSEMWQLILYWGVITGIGTGIITNVLSSTIAIRWFTRYRGLIIGAFGAAAAAGQLIFLPLLISVADGGGWRVVFMVLLGAIGIALIPAVLLMRDTPKDVGAEPLGGIMPQTASETRYTPLREALKTRDFWLLAGSFFVCGYTTNGLIGTHLLPHSLEHGFVAADISWALALMGLMNIFGTMGSGWLSDRYDNRKLLATYYGFRAISLVALPFIYDMQNMLIFSIIYGLDWVATVPPTVNLCGQRFGRASLGTIYGWVFFSHMVGAAVASYAGGFFRTLMGDYHLIFISAAVMGLVAVGLSLSISSMRKYKMA
jgi:sugar phosphate permease